MLLVGIAIGALAMLGFSSMIPHSVTPYVVEGYSNGANSDCTAIGVSKEPTGPGEGYVIARAIWREFGGPWHLEDTRPPSLAQPNTGQKVRLGVVYVKPVGDAPGGPVVAWIEVSSE
jgi:hypothetical protein